MVGSISKSFLEFYLEIFLHGFRGFRGFMTETFQDGKQSHYVKCSIGRSTSVLRYLAAMVYSFPCRDPLKILDDHDIICKARTTPSKYPVSIYRNVESEGSIAKPIDCLVEETETHILVGLFLLCTPY